MDPLIELMRLGQFSLPDQQQQVPDSSPDSPNNGAYGASPDSPAAPSASPQPQGTGDGVSGFVNGFLNSFKPQTSARDSLTSMMNQMPQYQPPGFFSKLEAGLIGATRGPAAAQQYLQQPYERDLNAWQNKVKVGQQLASDESQSNNVGRSIAVAQQTASDREQKMQNDLTTAQGKLTVAEQRAQVYQQNADTNKAKLDIMRETAKGGTLQFDAKTDQPFMVYKDGTSKPLTGVDGQPIQGHLFSPQDKQEMIDVAAMARTETTQVGANQRNAATIAGAAGRERSREDTAKSIESLKIEHGANSPFGSTTETTTTSGAPNILQRAAPGLFGTGITSKTTMAVKTPNTAQNKVPDATSIPLAQRTDGMPAMVGGQLMHWSKASGGWVK